MSCVHERCGGCALLSLTAAEQLVRKRGHVGAAFARYEALARVELPEVEGAEPAFAYRTRAKLVVSTRGEIGLYARGTHDVVDIPHCLVLAPKLLAVVAALREQLAAFAGSRSPVVAVDLREVGSAECGVLLTLIGEARDEALLRACAERAAKIEAVLGVAIGRRERGSPQLLGEAPEPVAGADVARDVLVAGGPYYYAAHGAFVQAHRGQASAVAERVRRELQRVIGKLEGAQLLELYAGSGALGLALARDGARVILVERYEPALALLSRAAEEQKLSGIATRAADAENALADLAQQERRFDAVIVNPPRRGLSPLVRARIAELEPRAVIYVSCDPQTLARDLADFARAGLAPSALQPFDMMPQSDDVECVVTLEPRAPAPIAILYEDDALLTVDKPPHLPTIPQAEHESSLLDRLRTQLGTDVLHAVHRLDAGTSGVCLFAKAPEHVEALAAALAAGQKSYTALVRGVTNGKGIIKMPLRDDGTTREAITRYTRKSVAAGHALLRVRPEQGRKHQVRRHLASINHAVVGDERYGAAPTNQHFAHKYGLDRAFLHLSRVELVLPGRAEPLVLEAPLAPDLQAVLAALAEKKSP